MAERGSEPGGIFGLLDLIEEHRAGLEYDFRHRFHLGLSCVPDEIGWDEALRLVRILRADPSSALAASFEGWDHPISREALILMDQFDLDMAVNSGKRNKPKPHPMRPWKQQGDVQRYGNTGGRSRSEVVEILNAMGHSLPV